jgi:hypothetical protein
MDPRLHRVLLALTILVLLPRDAAACPICLGAADSPLLDAARLGVIAMVTVTLGVLAAFGAWFVRLARREAAALDRSDPQ